MILSKASKYAIRAVLYLSINSKEDKKYSPKEIADSIDVPAPFLAKVLQVLTKRNFITSIRGRNGGFYLTEKNKLNSLLSIIYSIDQESKFNECLLGLPECGDKDPCPIHHAISPMKESLMEELSTKTIEDLTKEVKEGKTHIVLKDIKRLT